MTTVTRVAAWRRDSLARNSGHLLLSALVTAGGGFLFWQVSARVLTQTQVGVAATLVSAAMLLATFGLVGMDVAALHYLGRSSGGRSATASTGATVVALLTGAGATAFVVSARVLVPGVTVLRRPSAAVAFVVITMALAGNLYADSLFVALRASRFVLVRALVLNGLRLVAPLALATMLGFGAFAAYGIAAGASLALGVSLLRRHLDVVIRPGIDGGRFRAMWRFSAGNYVALSISAAPTLLLPVLVSNRLGPRVAALWFVAALISGVLTSIPQATTQSFYAEVVADPEALARQLRKVLGLTGAYEGVALLGLLALGWPVLALFGGSYTDAYPVLALLSVASAIGSIGYVARTVLLAAGRLRTLTRCTTASTVMVLVGSLAVLDHGLVPVAVAWVVAELVSGALYAEVIRRALATAVPSTKEVRHG